MGTGAVAFNLAPQRAILCDINPHLINFYSSILSGEITPEMVKDYLTREGENLSTFGEKRYYLVRDRFNQEHSPLDFLFLNRAGFNGMIRFNKKGEFNVPFCRKPQRFSQAYVTKIVNQVRYVSKLLKLKQFTFKCQNFSKTIQEAGQSDILYCDPPYIDRHVDYYNGWNSTHETELFEQLSRFGGKFILSTWHHNDYRENEYIRLFWSKFRILTRQHYYYVGAREENRNSMMEALVTNFDVQEIEVQQETPVQFALFDQPSEYDLS